MKTIEYNCDICGDLIKWESIVDEPLGVVIKVRHYEESLDATALAGISVRHACKDCRKELIDYTAKAFKDKLKNMTK